MVSPLPGLRYGPGPMTQTAETAAEQLTIADVRAAAARIEGHVVRTAMDYSRTLSQITGAQVFLKFENLQFTASFKERGALNKMAQLTPAERAQCEGRAVVAKKLKALPVEAVIALSILFLARELARSHLTPYSVTGQALQRPWAVAFVFGLLHGFARFVQFFYVFAACYVFGE